MKEFEEQKAVFLFAPLCCDSLLRLQDAASAGLKRMGEMEGRSLFTIELPLNQVD
jgi:hypothetical protein